MPLDNNYLSIRSTLDLQAREMIRSVGCLLLYLTTVYSHDHFEGDPVQLPIQSFASLHLERYLSINRVRSLTYHHVGISSRPGDLQHDKSSLTDKRSWSRETGLYAIQSTRPNTVRIGSTTHEAVGVQFSLEQDGCSALLAM